MLLAVDVGNTQIAVGLFDGSELKAHWRIATRSDQTGDELAVVFSELLGLSGLGFREIREMVVASVVPSLTSSIIEMADKVIGARPMVVGPGIKTGIPILYDNPHEVGADRIVNAVSGFQKYGGPLIIVDFGTATTFNLISEDGRFLGGAIAPQMELAASALAQRAAQLYEVELRCPESVIGKTTDDNIRSGFVLGFLDLVSGLIRRFRAEYAQDLKVIVTGGRGEFFAKHIKEISVYDPHLTLQGLRIAWELRRKL
ncbi:MAG: type III pantothenate kinase [Candidatus Bipolaricaulota bacterium]|nr:type III pantothenate kinase [Candidatus Bipolaricaulota bacterium]